MTWIVIDIDGVLNPFFARNNPNLTGFVEHRTDNNLAFLNPELQKPWLEVLSQQASLIWGSAWAEESNDVLEMLNIDQQWGWIPLQTEDVGLGTWKIKSIRRWVEENLVEEEKLVWVDDELEGDAVQWAEQRGNMLTVIPERHQGLTEQHFQLIHQFINQ